MRDANGNAEAAVAAIDPANAAGSQSLLLEASDDGTTGAVPFSGTVDWTQGQGRDRPADADRQGHIPARNLAVDVLIRKNSDPSLPASHLMEINFKVTDSFIGGSVAGLPGVLLKNEELVQGTPLVGASARVVGNSFLFALSASPEDSAANIELLTSRKWMDLAMIYATGKRAIITLEKDEAAEKLFNEVFAAWAEPEHGRSGSGSRRSQVQARHSRSGSCRAASAAMSSAWWLTSMCGPVAADASACGPGRGWRRGCRRRAPRTARRAAAPAGRAAGCAPGRRAASGRRTG